MATPHKLLLLVSLVAVGITTSLFLFPASITVLPTVTQIEAPHKPSTTTIALVTDKPTYIFFTGDIMLARHVEVLLRDNLIKPYDFASLFSSAAAVFINFESAMANPHVKTPSGAMQFSTSRESLSLLATLHVTHASLANNHSRDHGQTGYAFARSTLSELGISTFGDAVTLSSSSLTYTTVGSTTIAVLGVHTLFVPPNRSVLKSLLTEAKAKSDLQFVYIHWGDEYELIHNQSQEALATWLAEEGVDAVIGHHPHVVQDIGLIGTMPVFYSLGNFVFDQYFSEEVTRGLVLGFVASPTNLQFSLYPQSQCAKATPCLMDKKREEAFLLELADRSDPRLFDQIVAKNIVIPR